VSEPVEHSAIILKITHGDQDAQLSQARRSLVKTKEIKMQKQLFAALMAVTFLSPIAAQADGSYVKFSAGRSEYKGDEGKTRDNALSLAYGFAVDKNFDVELGYINLGKVKDSGPLYTYSAERQAFYLAGVGSLPVTDAFSVSAKLGLALNRYEDKLFSVFGNETEKETKVRLMLGLGTSYQFTKEVAGVLEYQYFGKISDVKSSALTVGVRYGF
jgi:OmpA-OmpF porin, OOP family